MVSKVRGVCRCDDRKVSLLCSDVMHAAAVREQFWQWYRGWVPAGSCRSERYAAWTQEKETVKQHRHQSRRNLTKPTQNWARICKKERGCPSLVAAIISQPTQSCQPARRLVEVCERLGEGTYEGQYRPELAVIRPYDRPDQCSTNGVLGVFKANETLPTGR